MMSKILIIFLICANILFAQIDESKYINYLQSAFFEKEFQQTSSFISKLQEFEYLFPR